MFDIYIFPARSDSCYMCVGRDIVAFFISNNYKYLKIKAVNSRLYSNLMPRNLHIWTFDKMVDDRKCPPFIVKIR